MNIQSVIAFTDFHDCRMHAHCELHLTTPEQRLVASQRLEIECRLGLTASERDFVSWFAHHTVLLGRTSLRATQEQMAKGTRSFVPVGQSLRTIKTNIKSLKQKGLISVMPGDAVKTYSIKLDWKHDHTQAQMELDHQLEAAAANQCFTAFLQTETNDAGRANSAHAQCKSCTPNNKKKSSDKKKKEEGSRAAPRLAPWDWGLGSGDTEVSAPAVRHRSRPATQAPAVASSQPVAGRPIKPTRPVPVAPARPVTAKQAIQSVLFKTGEAQDEQSPLNTAAVWQLAWQEAFPDVPHTRLTKVELGMLNTLKDKLVLIKGFDFNAYLHFCVTEWRSLMMNEFGWMKKRQPPHLPVVGFLVKLSAQFEEAYASRKYEQSIHKRTWDEQVYNDLRTAKKMTHDEAMLELGKRKAQREERGQIEKEKGEVARMRRIVEAEKEAAQRARAKVQIMMAAHEKGIPLSALDNRPRWQKPVIDHGDNPYEQENPEILDFLTLNLKWED